MNVGCGYPTCKNVGVEYTLVCSGGASQQPQQVLITCMNLNALEGACVESVSPNSDGADRVVMGFDGAHHLKCLNVPLHNVLISRATVQVSLTAMSV